MRSTLLKTTFHMSLSVVPQNDHHCILSSTCNFTLHKLSSTCNFTLHKCETPHYQTYFSTNRHTQMYALYCMLIRGHIQIACILNIMVYSVVHCVYYYIKALLLFCTHSEHGRHRVRQEWGSNGISVWHSVSCLYWIVTACTDH